MLQTKQKLQMLIMKEMKTGETKTGHVCIII